MKTAVNFSVASLFFILSSFNSVAQERSPGVDKPEPGTSKEVTDKDGNTTVEPAEPKERNTDSEPKDSGNDGSFLIRKEDLENF